MTEPVVHVIDDDEAMRQSLSFLLDSAGLVARTYESATAFLAAGELTPPGCIVTDVRMPEMSGLELVRKLKERGDVLPIVMITGHGDVPLAVEAMKAGVMDFLEKPFDDDALLSSIHRALETGAPNPENGERARFRAVLEQLSPRERDVLAGVVAGKANKVIAFELGISPRTVEVYRANVMTKTRAGSLSELIRMTIVADI
ncbi:MAG TPA: response regulator FixJ [Phenylobacterium sp.]